MWFVFLRRTHKRCIIKHNRIIWFMNRNASLEQSIIWHKMPESELAVASFTDDGTLTNSEFREILSCQENAHSLTLPDPVEHRHYIARRSFQRLFLSEVLSTNIAPNKLEIIHKRDTRPKCANAPRLNLSFSSSGMTAIACASSCYPVGIDIERYRIVENVVALAKRYFTHEEAEALANLAPSEQSKAFLHYWTAKEAGLKAIGKGIVFGLNTFCLKANGNLSFEIMGPPQLSKSWNLQYQTIIPQHLIALVKKNNVGKL
jgi:phosphopantetheinyl transferase